MPTLFCCILNCDTESSNLNTKRRKIFYRFPQNSDRKQLWLSQIGGENRIKYGAISGNSRICNVHFATGKPNLDSNHIDYAPTLFPWSSIDERHKIFEAVEQYELKIKELEQKILAKAFLSVSKEAAPSTETSRSNQITELRPSQNTVNQNHLSHSATNQVNSINSNHSNITKTNPTTQPPQMLTTKVLNNIDSNNNNSNSNTNTSTTLNLTSANVLQYLLNSLSSVTNLSTTTSSNNNIEDVNCLPKLPTPSAPTQINDTINTFSDHSEDLMRIKSEQITDSKLLIHHNNDNSPLNLSNTTTNESKGFAMRTNLEPDYLDRHIHDNHISVYGTTETKVTIEDSQLALNNTTRSCTCTKSGCLKLYCECFSSGNVCSDTCSCNNCKNNGNHAEERAKIINLYLERDPSVFNSKIENKEVGKKHSKGCNCLKSSCLKNYCECFENKVLCSNLCRCRRCFNTDRVTKDESCKGGCADSSINGSETMSMTSVNSPQTIQSSSSTNHGKSNKINRKRRAPKSIDMYEDVSSIESDADTVKQSHIDVETVSPSNSLFGSQCNQESLCTKKEATINLDDLHNSSLIDNDKSTKYSSTNNHGNCSSASTTNPPSNQSSLPREQDYTEEELALMQKLRKQRKHTEPKSINPISLPAQPVAIVTESSNSNNVNYYPQNTTNINPTLVNNASPVSGYFNNNQFSSTVDILQLLVAQQLLSSSPINKNILPTNPTAANPVASQFIVNKQKTESPDSVLPQQQQLSPIIIQHHNIHASTPLIKSPGSLVTTKLPLTSTPSLTNKDHPPLSISSSTVTTSHNKTPQKISTEDYVRKHIEAAERAVRADNLRKETLTNYATTNGSLPSSCPPNPVGSPTIPISTQPGPNSKQKQTQLKQKIKHELTTSPTSSKLKPSAPIMNKTSIKTTVPSVVSMPTKSTHRTQMKREIKSIKSEISNIKLRMLLDKTKVKKLERSLYKLESNLNRKFKMKTL